MTLAEVQIKWSVIFMDCLGPDIFPTLQRSQWKRAHFQVEGWSLVWNALLTKLLPMFLSRLNEINGGYENILPVSGSFWSHLTFFRMIDFTAWLWWRNARVNGIRSLFPILLLWRLWCWLPINLLGAMMACFNNQDRHVCRRNRTVEKSESSLQRQEV